MLKELRKEVDNIDDELIKLLEKRFEITKKIGEYKALQQIEVLDKNREYEILKKIKNNKLEYEDEIIEIFECLMLNSKIQQKEFECKDLA